MIPKALLQQLRKISDLDLIEDSSRLKVYESDGLTALAVVPPAVVLPHNLKALEVVLGL